MARNLYTICSKLGSEDRTTGLLSLYQIIEELTATLPAPGQQSLPFVIRVTSVWMREDGDDAEQEYEFRMVWHLDALGLENELSRTMFHFSTRIRRFISEFVLQGLVLGTTLERLEGPSLMVVDCSMRVAGADTWITQSYPMLITWVQPPMQQSVSGDSAASQL
jgi:hypothetical protein